MAKDYQRLWKDVTNAKSEAQCVRILAEILADQEGRRFVSYLGREDAELCIEILDRVSRDLSLPPFFVFSAALSGNIEVQSQIHRKTQLLCHAEETCCLAWAFAGVDTDNRED